MKSVSFPNIKNNISMIEFTCFYMILVSMVKINGGVTVGDFKQCYSIFIYRF